VKKPPKENFLEWLSDKCLEIWEREGIWIDRHWDPEELEDFFTSADPYLHNIGINGDDEIWRAYWTAILNIAYKIADSNLRWEFFADPDDYDGVAIVVVDQQGKCLTCGNDGSIAARLSMRKFGSVDEFRQFLIDTAAKLFLGGEKK